LPYRAFKRNLTVSYFAPVVISLSVLAGIGLWAFHSQASITSRIEHSDQVILGIKDIELEVREMQTATRGYLLTSDKADLSELGDARDALEKNISKISGLVADNPIQEQRLIRIVDLKRAWINAVESLISQRTAGQFNKESFAQGHARSRAIVKALEDFIRAEHQLRARRMSRQTTAYYVVLVVIPLLSAFVMVLLSYWGWHQIQLATEQFRQALDKAEQARREAEKANRAKDNFIATVSHELRNPLNSIMLWSTALLGDTKLGEQTRRGMTAIERAVRAQAQLIEDLLDISRIENGRMRLDVQAVDLAEVVRAGVENMRIAAEAKSITLQEMIDPRVGSVAGDPGRLQQVVWNLVSNAVKFTEKGGKIQVRVERINSHIEIVVADTGQGIEPAVLGSVFDRFWQADGSGQTRNGVGLGLSIVREIAGLHGARLWRIVTDRARAAPLR